MGGGGRPDAHSRSISSDQGHRERVVNEDQSHCCGGKHQEAAPTLATSREPSDGTNRGNDSCQQTHEGQCRVYGWPSFKNMDDPDTGAGPYPTAPQARVAGLADPD